MILEYPLKKSIQATSMQIQQIAFEKLPVF